MPSMTPANSTSPRLRAATWAPRKAMSSARPPARPPAGAAPPPPAARRVGHEEGCEERQTLRRLLDRRRHEDRRQERSCLVARDPAYGDRGYGIEEKRARSGPRDATENNRDHDH